LLLENAGEFDGSAREPSAEPLFIDSLIVAVESKTPNAADVERYGDVRLNLSSCR
jgi:hypothetical protein